MQFKDVFSQWSTAFRDIAATQFGYAMDAWKAWEKAVNDSCHFWKK